MAVSTIKSISILLYRFKITFSDIGQVIIPLQVKPTGNSDEEILLTYFNYFIILLLLTYLFMLSWLTFGKKPYKSHSLWDSLCHWISVPEWKKPVIKSYYFERHTGCVILRCRCPRTEEAGSTHSCRGSLGSRDRESLQVYCSRAEGGWSQGQRADPSWSTSSSRTLQASLHPRFCCIARVFFSTGKVWNFSEDPDHVGAPGRGSAWWVALRLTDALSVLLESSLILFRCFLVLFRCFSNTCQMLCHLFPDALIIPFTFFGHIF